MGPVEVAADVVFSPIVAAVAASEQADTHTEHDRLASAATLLVVVRRVQHIAGCRCI